jgi:hypothetical protein
MPGAKTNETAIAESLSIGIIYFYLLFFQFIEWLVLATP